MTDKLLAKADELNASLAERRDDVKWFVRNGRLSLEDCPEWSARRAKEIQKRNEEERQKFITRRDRPLDLEGGSDDR